MSKYHKIKQALDSYIEQERYSNDLTEKMGWGREHFDDEVYAALERKLLNSEEALAFALKTLAKVVPDNVCPIGLINQYTEDKALALQPYVQV